MHYIEESGEVNPELFNEILSRRKMDTRSEAQIKQDVHEDIESATHEITEKYLLSVGFEKHKNWDVGVESYSINKNRIYFSITLATSHARPNYLAFRKGILGDWFEMDDFTSLSELKQLFKILTKEDLETNE